jgi:hypothetical protein
MANTVHVLDNYYLAVTFLVTVGYQVCCCHNPSRDKNIARLSMV